MTNVSMELVKELREKTQISLMECKKALIETAGDLEKAIDLLRKRGAAVAAKRADNEATQGRIEAFVSADEKSGSLVKVACETDFSANTDAMKIFAQNVAQQSVLLKSTLVDELLSLASPSLGKMQDVLDELIAKIAENIKVSTAAHFELDGPGLVHAYIHPGSHVGAMIMLKTDKDVSNKELLRQIAKDLCMQIAVTRPMAIMPEELDQAVLQKERAFVTESVAQSGKPAAMVEKIVEGKLKKYCEEVCLFYQPFIKNDKITIGSYLADVSKQLGVQISIARYIRFGIGSK